MDPVGVMFVVVDDWKLVRRINRNFLIGKTIKKDMETKNLSESLDYIQFFSPIDKLRPPINM